MKTFSTPEYITPIINVISALYDAITDPVVCSALHCDLLLQSHHSRNALAVRRDQPFYFGSSCGLVKELYNDIKDYSETASTYDGELDSWRYAEEQRVQHAIRDALLAKYVKGA